jgi:hypothetical protein
MPPPAFEYSARDWFEREVARLQEENAMLRAQLTETGAGGHPGCRPVMETIEGPRA